MYCFCTQLVVHGTGNLRDANLFMSCFSGRLRLLRNAKNINADRNYSSVVLRVKQMRFNSCSLSRISIICCRSKHKFAEKISDNACNHSAANITQRSNLLNKVSALVGFDGLHDFIESEGVEKQSISTSEEVIDDQDISFACKRFPSVSLGSFPRVDLYDQTTSVKKSFSEAGSHEELPYASHGETLVDSDRQEIFILPSEMTPPCPFQSHLHVTTKESDRSAVAWKETSIGLEENEVKSVHSACVEEILNTDGKSNELIDTPICNEPSGEVDNDTQESLDAVPVHQLLDRLVSCIPGISKRQYLQLENCGFYTLRKLLHHFPRSYADLQNAHIGIDDGQYLISIGEVLSSRAVRASRSFSFLEVIVGCKVIDHDIPGEDMGGDIDERRRKTIFLHLKKYFRGTRFTYAPFLHSIQSKHKEGEIVCVSGKVKTMSKNGHYEMREYNIDVLKDEKDSSIQVKGRPYPIYPSKGDLKPNSLHDIIERALKTLSDDFDPIPTYITKEFGLLRLHDAYFGIHQPKSMDEADFARKRFIFDEFFYLQLGRLFQMLEGLGTKIEKNTLLKKYAEPELHTVHMDNWSDLTRKFLKALPFSLTSSQLHAVCEIIWDLKRPVPMNRLLQGDVGCGKTVVAFLACMEVIGCGYQAAFMVPTELLAIQHYEHMLNLLEAMEDVKCKPSIALLTGSTSSKQSRMIRQGLQGGDISMVIGTHSLISDRLEFCALRIAVIDEQHRFGVVQRGRFNSKLYNTSISSKVKGTSSDESPSGDLDMAPHILAMSATPIPRTLALALYGDMSLTQITGLPPGRIPIETFVIEGNESGFDNVYKMMLDELEAGGKVYLVYPVIEQSEQLPQLRAAAGDLEAMSCRFQGYSCGLLHGKMKSDEKDEALRRFRSGETHVLLSTQVIEIGVDVPDASMMVVMNAERFGIAQLHQLRGRVGRGTRKSKCILIASATNSVNRLKVLQNSSDGFHLANIDLLIRGPGDLLGKKQSGHLPEFPIARLGVDGNILQEAHLAALKILGTSHNLEKFPKLKAELSMRQPLCLLGD